MYRSAAGGAASEAYVDIRVCDLQLQQGNMPSGLDSVFHVDGLYVVLRCGEEVRRTHCLWPSADASSTPYGSPTDAAAAAAAAEEAQNDWVWNELFRFPLPPASEQSAASMTALSHGVSRIACAGRRQDAAATSNSSATSTPPLSSSAGPSPVRATGGANSNAAISAFALSDAPPAPSSQRSSPFLYPAIDLELWRSTPTAEHCLGRYTYHVPLELLHGGYGLHPSDLVAERVVPLRTKEAPSIMGNLYGWSGHRLSLRLRVQAIGLAPLTSDWTLLPSDTGANSYALPYSLAMAEGSQHGAPYSSPYAASMGNLNPVLANLLAPLGLPGGTGQGPVGRPVPGVTGVGVSVQGGLPPVFPNYAAQPAAAEGRGGVAVLPSSAGVLGDGDPAWRGAVLPAVFPS